MANYLAQTGIVDEVWLMPGRVNPLKALVPPADPLHRVAMCDAVARRCVNVSVCDAELALPEPSYTCSTLDFLSRKFPDRRFFLLIGSDNWLCFGKWRDHDRILANFGILIYPRPGYPVSPGSLPENVSLLEDAPQALISSTFIREGLKGKRNMNFFIPHDVAEYISAHKLYE